MSKTIFIDEPHDKNFHQNLWEQVKNEAFCDVVLIAGIEKKKIPAHRAVLSAASDYFNGMFKASMRESTSKEVELPNVDFKILKSLVKYCYLRRVQISEDIVVDLMKTANQFLLSNVVTACGDFLTKELHPSNCLGFMLLAEENNSCTLQQQAKEYCLKHFIETYQYEEFLNLSAEELGKILAYDELCVTDEKNVFKSVIAWIEHDHAERNKHKAELLKLVRLPLLDRSFLIDNVKPFCTSTECHQIYIETLESQLVPKSIPHHFGKLAIPRKCDKFLLALTTNNSEMFIHYYCPEELMWKQRLKELEYRINFHIAVMEDELYIVGGYNAAGGITSSIICLNLSSMTLKVISPMPEALYWCCTAVVNELLYVVGGINNSNVPITSVRSWNPKTNIWNLMAPMSNTRSNFSIAVLDKKLFAVGGNANGSAECYDSSLNVWTPIASTMSTNPKIVAASGSLYAIGTCNNVKIIERYEMESNEWIPLRTLKYNISSPFFCFTFNNKIVIFNGIKSEEYNILTNEWETCTAISALNDTKCIFSYSGALLTFDFDFIEL